MNLDCAAIHVPELRTSNLGAADSHTQSGLMDDHVVRRSRIEDFLTSHPERDAGLAVVLRYMQGMPIGEISEILQCTEGVTKNILFRSVRRMRDTLAGTAGVSHA